MSKHITEYYINSILKIISMWNNEKLTWNDLVDAVEGNLGVRYTRQCLSNYKIIVDAFNLKKKYIRQNRGCDPVCGTQQMQDAFHKIRQLELEVELLKKQNKDLLEQFWRWLYNATHSTRHPMRVEDLNKPLPENKRS